MKPNCRAASVVDLNGDEHTLQCRTVLMSPGSVPSVLPIPGLAEHAVSFKTLADAIWLRTWVLRQLEAADATDGLAERRRLLTFTFVGGGYAGVEALAELESLCRDALRNYPRIAQSELRWVLVEGANTLLPGLDARLAKYTEKQLRRRGIHLHLSTTMTSCEEGIGRLAAVNIAADLGVGTAGPFAYRNRGLAVTLGRNDGTAQVKRFTFRGFAAWWMGRSYHLLMMPGMGRRLRVVSDWTLSLFFPRDVSQLGTLGNPTRLRNPAG